MVWFQCEGCGENLKKPKLSNHFRICSAYKLSCIDCGLMFDQQSVQAHTQCISEAEKYGPKGEGKDSRSVQSKPVKPKRNSDIDVNVGLSSRAPWFCSLCNTYTTSQQTLLGHADGKKHRAKARAFHAAQKQSDQTEESTAKEDPHPARRKRKHDASIDRPISEIGENNACESSNGEVVQAELSKRPHSKSKKNNCSYELLRTNDGAQKHELGDEASETKIKWKKLVTSALKTNPRGIMKIKKLRKLIVKALKESGITEDEERLQDKLMQKISSSSRFTIANKHIHLVMKTENS